MHNVTKQIIVGLAIAVISTSAMSIKSIYDDVQLNTQFRVESVDVVDDLKALRKDVCWIKEHLRGEKIPKCNM